MLTKASIRVRSRNCLFAFLNSFDDRHRRDANPFYQDLGSHLDISNFCYPLNELDEWEDPKQCQ